MYFSIRQRSTPLLTYNRDVIAIIFKKQETTGHHLCNKQCDYLQDIIFSKVFAMGDTQMVTNILPTWFIGLESLQFLIVATNSLHC